MLMVKGISNTQSSFRSLKKTLCGLSTTHACMDTFHFIVVLILNSPLHFVFVVPHGLHVEIIISWNFCSKNLCIETKFLVLLIYLPCVKTPIQYYFNWFLNILGNDVELGGTFVKLNLGQTFHRSKCHLHMCGPCGTTQSLKHLDISRSKYVTRSQKRHQMLNITNLNQTFFFCYHLKP